MPALFKNITDLPVGVTINGTDVFEMVSAGTNVQVTANTVAAAIGGGASAQVFSGLADPASPPSDSSKVALWFNENTGYGWRWVVKDQNWV